MARKPIDTKERIKEMGIGALLHFSFPNAIENEEKAGQEYFVEESMLPKDCPRIDLEKMGIVFGEDVDDLFIAVTLPPGWKKEITEHSMWSNLIDDKGRKRGAIFYKAAFYDRSAHMYLSRRFSIDCDFVDLKYDDPDFREKSKIAPQIGRVMDGEKIIYETESQLLKDYPEREGYLLRENLRDQCKTWLKEHYPDWEDPLAYWE